MKARPSRKPRISGTARRVTATLLGSYTSDQHRRHRELEDVVKRLKFFSPGSKTNKEPVNKAALMAATKARFSTGGLSDFHLREEDPMAYLLDHLVVISTQKEVTLIYASRVSADLSFKGTLTKNVLSDDVFLWDKSKENGPDDPLLNDREDKARFVGTVPDPNWAAFHGTLSDYGLEARATYTHAQIAKAAGSVAKFFELLYG